MNSIYQLFTDSVQVKNKILQSDALDNIKLMGDEAITAIQNGNKIMLCGNGGSAADAQHLAAELLVRLKSDNNRRGIPALVLAQDTSTITACGNDFGYDFLYTRVLQALAKKGDILIVLTTSGNSKNIILAMQQARELGVMVFAFLGCGGGAALELSDLAFVVPSDDTGRIQEAHITAGHALMEYVENGLFASGYL